MEQRVGLEGWCEERRMKGDVEQVEEGEWRRHGEECSVSVGKVKRRWVHRRW